MCEREQAYETKVLTCDYCDKELCIITEKDFCDQIQCFDCYGQDIKELNRI